MSTKPLIKLKPTLWDGAVAVAILALAVGLGAFMWHQSQTAGDHLTCVISWDGQVVQTVELSKVEKYMTVSVGKPTVCVVELMPNQVRMKSSDCASQACVHTGWISRAGQSIVCLPNRVVVELTGGTSDVDVVLGG